MDNIPFRSQKRQILVFRGGKKILHNPIYNSKFIKRIYTQSAPDYSSMETFNQIRNKSRHVSPAMSPGTFYMDDYADFEGVEPGSQIFRGAATAEAKLVRGFVPGNKGTRF